MPCIIGTLTELLYSFEQSTSPLTQYGITNEFCILNCEQSFEFLCTFLYYIAGTALTYMFIFVHLVFFVVTTKTA